MTKRFCDLCEKPAVEHWPTMKVEFPNMTWSGSKSSNGSPNPTDGRWTPFVEARVIFDAHDMKHNTYAHHPDLCSECIASMLLNIASSMVVPATIEKS